MRGVSGKCITAASFAIFLSISGCSSSADKTNQDSLSSTEVCDSTFRGVHAKEIENLTGAERFKKVGDVNFDKFVSHLDETSLETSPKNEEFCRIYTIESDGRPAATIGFGRRPDFPSADHGDDWRLYETGQHAHTSDNGAYLYFQCPDNKSSADAQYIKGSLSAARHGAVTPDDLSKMTMSTLNAVSLQVAHKLGCTKESNLTAQAPLHP